MDPVASESETANVVEETPTCPEMTSNLRPSPSSGTKATDNPLSANTSQADRESGAGASHEKFPHSQADAKPAETAMPEDTIQADEGLDSGEIHEKPPYSQTETNLPDVTMGLDTSEADQERSDGATFGKKVIRLGTKATDTPVSANTSQVDQDPGAGASHEKFPHSQADAKPAETAMPVGTTQADEGLDSGEIHEKPPYSQTETNAPDVTMGLDTSEADQERSAGATFGLLAAEKEIRLGTKATDTPVSANTSQADRESGAGASHEKSPHSQADAKPAETAMPVGTTQADEGLDSGEIHEKPPYSQTETNVPDTTMGLDTSEADQERNDGKTFEQLIADMKTRLASLFDTLPDSDQEHDVIKPLLGKLYMSKLVLLKGSKGCGKTTAALMLARHYMNTKFQDVNWINIDEVPRINTFVLKQRCFIVIDDFLGKNTSESFARWKRFRHFMIYAQRFGNRIQFILTTTAGILDDLIARTGAELHFINDVVTISMDHVKLWNSMKSTTAMKSPLDLDPSCGFPVCCHLVPHVPADIQKILFQQPMLALRQTVRRMMDSSNTARSALALLALSKGGLDTNALLRPHKPAVLQKLLQHLQLQGQTFTDIVPYYQNCHGFIKVQDNMVYFTNEAVQDAVLVALSECQAEFLSTNCCIELQSQLALATSDDSEDSEKAEKPKLPAVVIRGFAISIMEEMKSTNYQLAFSSALFQHRSFKQTLELKMTEEKLLENCLDTYGLEGLHFLFHAGAVDFIWKHSLDVFNKENYWLVLQALLACCFWGQDQDIPQLLQIFENMNELKKHLKDATIQKIVSGNLPGISKKTEPDWERTPMYPKDTLLTMAAWRGNDDVVKLLVARGMAVNSRGKDGRTALVHYCAKGNGTMVRFLLECNADASLSDDMGQSSLMHAMWREEWAIPEELFTQSNIRSVIYDRTSTLMAACLHGWKVQTVQKLIDHGVVTLKDDLGWTCFHYACVSGCTDLVSFLLERPEVNSSQQANDGLTPLMLAVTSPGRSQLVRVLLRSLEPKDAIDKDVVKIACLFSDQDVVELLFKSIDRDELLLPALQSASKFGNVDIVRYFILHRNVNPANVICERGHTLLHTATFGSNLECIKFLLSKINPNSLTASRETPLLFALGNGRVDFAKQLRSAGAKTDAVDSNGYGCLHYAVESQSLRALRWCIEEEGMDVNMKSLKGMTPLYKAVWMEDARLVQYLLDKGANIKAADVNGVTALDVAKRLRVKNVLDILLTWVSH